MRLSSSGECIGFSEGGGIVAWAGGLAGLDFLIIYGSSCFAGGLDPVVGGLNVFLFSEDLGDSFSGAVWGLVPILGGECIYTTSDG